MVDVGEGWDDDLDVDWDDAAEISVAPQELTETSYSIDNRWYVKSAASVSTSVAYGKKAKMWAMRGVGTGTRILSSLNLALLEETTRRWAASRVKNSTWKETAKLDFDERSSTGFAPRQPR